MLALLLAVSTLVAVSGAPHTTIFPHGHALVVLIDERLENLDHNPKDGIITLTEWDAMQQWIDNDTDKCITEPEYLQMSPDTPPEVMTAMYNHYDHNNDNCIEMDDMIAEFHLADKDKNGELTMHEGEQYFSHMFNHLFGHGSHVVG